MSSPSRTCIFCQQRGVSREHAWPKWLLSSIGNCNPSSMTEALLGPKNPSVTWTGPEVTVNCVCRTCNNGWMSDLEGRARPIVGSLLNDVSFSLDSSQQSDLTLWSVKTAMVFEATDRTRRWFYSDVNRKLLCNSREIPHRTRVWIGRYAQSNILCSEARKLYERTPRDANPFAGGHVVTFVICRLAIQVLTLRLKPEFETAAEVTLHINPGPWESLLSQIRPAESKVLKWPPRMSFDNSGITFEQLSGRFVAGRQFN
jgi:hypothetical protein